VAAPVSKIMEKTGAAASKKQANILLVDDQPGKLLTYQAILADIGANLVTASSAREALEHLLKTEFAVVIVDVCMPELDGFELAEMIRDHPRFRQTAIIFVSGVHLSDLDRMKGYERGAVDYLPVPIVPEILRAKVRVFVELHMKTRELERLNKTLERRVAQRTEELEEANRRKDQFLAVLAHELRNPLAAIRMAAQSLNLPETDTSDRERWSTVIERQVGHLSRLIDDLVDVSRITRGTIELQRKAIDIGGVIAEAIEASRPIIDDRKHNLVVHLPDDSPLRVFGDAARLVQVLANLIHNAAKFTPKNGHIDIAVHTEGDEVVIQVKDDGIGIDPELVPQIFEMFSQVGRPLDRPAMGLGIGLALVRTLVELHGGTVTASSLGKGSGTALTVRLPRLDAPAVAEQAAVALPVSALPPSRILVVDDNADAADALAFMLRAAGHEVNTANDGLEALKLSPDFRPEIVLLDLGMPNLNGYATAHRIREQPWGQDVLLVALTGWGQPKDRDRTSRAGFNAHLVKPVGVEELFGTLAQLRTAH
jgi:signal transduction histidine kinase